ncbi:hypothetical protein [Aminobacter sp. MSH1]|uniref:hypothetical protein n=1 Tax=Aminobacter sp. MSH1 TaxID=374606 RepID=UPI001FDFA0D9|nr:hypothetical protein [Aminobacter sp. MSH1]
MAPLQLGMRAQRVSTIKSVDKKVGKSGPLVFVTVEHRISELGGEVKLVEEHDIVYRGLQSVADPAACPRVPDLERRFAATATPDEVMLFRFSALTFNGHRIHYDHPYVVNTEGYAGLIVHGPLIAMLLARMAELHGAAALRRFSFRSMSPFTLGGALSLNMSGPDEDGCHSLWAAADTDRLVMQAEAWLK